MDYDKFHGLPLAFTIDFRLRAGLPPEAIAAARDTLGGAVGAARDLGAVGDAMLAASRTVYTLTLQKAAWICAAIGAQSVVVGGYWMVATTSRPRASATFATLGSLGSSGMPLATKSVEPF